MIATDVFVSASTSHKALGVEFDTYRDYLRKPFQQMIRQGGAVAAVETATDELVWCLAIKQFAGDVDRYPVFAPLAALATELDRQYRTSRTLAGGQAVLVDMGAVFPDAAGAGV